MPAAYEVVIFGATGFTGKFVADYFATAVREQRPALRWALVGRDRAKLQQMADALAAEHRIAAPPILVASSDDATSVDAAVGQARVVLSTAGPFAKMGTPVVDACVRLGVHYVDINGETGWHRSIIDRYDAAARQKGVVLVPSCGFDSIPSDLGAAWVAGALASKFGVPARRVSCYVALRGNFSGGTVSSGIMSEETHGTTLSDPFLLGGKRPCCSTPRAEDADVQTAAFDEMVGSWTAPFGMATINTRIVRRSVGLLEEVQPGRTAAAAFARDFGYIERALAPAEAVAVKMARSVTVPAAKRRQLVEQGRLPKPGNGPTAEQRAKAWFRFLFVAEAADASKKVVGSVSGGDPGYVETAKMVAEAAVMLATTPLAELSPLAARGGLLTPTTAFGARLRERLHDTGILFEQLDGLPPMAPASKL